MQAITVERFGGPEVLQLQERPDPQGEVVVELRAAALNRHDLLLRRGQYPHLPLPRIPGSDGAGAIRGTGERVLVLPAIAWGDSEHAPGPGFEILGDHRDGTYAELVALPAANVRPIPHGWSDAEAAALGLAGLTAYRALFTRGNLQPGERVLVTGAGGGVATIAVALARMAGAHVQVTTSSAQRLDAAITRDGAHGGALYTAPDWTIEPVDLIVDSSGAIDRALTFLKPGGRVVLFGATVAERLDVELRTLYFGQHIILGTTMGSPRDFDGLLDLIATAPDWRPHIEHTFPLDRAADAHALLESGAHTGKVVLYTPR